MVPTPEFAELETRLLNTLREENRQQERARA
jgi:hypothetical protein